jgi:predicted  nucleic acid-binding Zn-ribbon protein
LREQLKLLEKLQRVDGKLHETQDLLTSLPVKLDSLKEDVSRVETLLEGERQQLTDVQGYKNDLEASMKADHDLMNKAKAKLTQVRTSKEYMATQRELESSRKGTGEREDELIKLMEAIESFQKSIKVHEEELAALQEHVDEEAAETAGQIADLKKKLAGQQKSRDSMASTIKKSVLGKYNAIRRRRGLAVVPAEEGVCTGCHMALPPQLYNILQRETSIEYCPSCQRIVYYETEAEQG